MLRLCLLSLLLLALRPAEETQARQPFATDLLTPIGLEMDTRGRLWVAQVGTGNNDGRISVVTPDGQVYPFLDGLGSVPEADGNAGTYHLRFIDGRLYFSNGMGTVTPEGYLLRVDTTGFTPGDPPRPLAAIDTVTNVGAFATDNGFPANNLYDLAEGPDGDLFLVDAGANALFRMDGATGALSVLATFDPIPNPTPVGPPMIDPVPTSVVYHEGRLYVSLFTGFPFLDGLAGVYEVSMTGEVTPVQEGLTLVTDLAVDPADGSLLALQMARFDLEGGFLPETGSLVRLSGGTVDTLLSGLMLPSAMYPAPDDNVYLSSLIGVVFKMPMASATSVEAEALPARFTLGPNYPNPFTASTHIHFHLHEPAHVTLHIFDLLGREVTPLLEGRYPAGTFEVPWQATGQPGGIYFYRLEANGQTQIRAMVLVR
ncbi:ScyD/ScyE family protein [Rhodocaloribacter litoris]|uniref:ScyD/ScyE family protein n=1 Tax=Rhodocaloribacter litoris TaxID=2558931 RepID=UPI00141DD478|nr:ScyD/ScyE family protein [Rhodocaloribacter litoris]QXD15201.1 ScyD/ScyE family protein [Rhodocaloribacter litoris]